MVPSCCCSVAFMMAGLGEGPGGLCWAGGPGSLLMLGGVVRGLGAGAGLSRPRGLVGNSLGLPGNEQTRSGFLPGPSACAGWARVVLCGRPGRTLRTALSAAGLWHLWWLPDAQPCPGRLSLRAEEQMDGGEEEGLGLAPLLSAPEGDSGGDCS